MSMTSAAEAKLDARVRPQITELRSRTPYPKRRSDTESHPAQPSAHASRPAASKRPAPIRLTRRGRIVVWTLVSIAVAGLAGLIWLAVAGQAQASGQAGPARLTSREVARVVVRSGQTLWGIAAKVDPGADPRVIIPEIVELNSLRSTSISVGQVLWVPRS